MSGTVLDAIESKKTHVNLFYLSSAGKTLLPVPENARASHITQIFDQTKYSDMLLNINFFSKICTY